MISRQKTLQVLDDFIVDRTLPKYHVEQKTETDSDKSVPTDSGGWAMPDPSLFVDSRISPEDELDYAWMHILDRRHGEVMRNPTIGNKLRLWWAKRLSDISKTMLVGALDRDRATISGFENPEEFFKAIKESISTVENRDLDSIHEFYVNSIKQATELGQVALAEQLLAKKDLIKLETILIQNNFHKFVSEKDVVQFGTKFGIKNLHLTWVKNFNRMIPAEVYEQKRKADALKVFDNYVILHTDATGESVSETAEERKKRIEREKDPILFGLIKDSRKLYYIGDWVDDYCDLTLDKVLSVLEKKACDELNDESIKKDIQSVTID